MTYGIFFRGRMQSLPNPDVEDVEQDTLSTESPGSREAEPRTLMDW